MKKTFAVIGAALLILTGAAAIFLKGGLLNYKVTTGGIASKNQLESRTTSSFASAKNSNEYTAGTHRFVFLSDSRGNNNGVNKAALTGILQQIKELNPQPEYLIIGGDLVSGSANDHAFISQLQNAKAILSAYYPISKIMPGFGNHEETGGSDASHDQIFMQIFKGFASTSTLQETKNTAYYLDDDNIRLIMLNSNYSGQQHEITGAQRSWLKECTKKGTNKITFVFIHEPPYPTGAHVGDSLDAHPDQRDTFWQMINDNNVMAVFCGHEHNYSRRLIDNSFNPLFTRPVYQIIAGTAGAPVYEKYTSKKGVVVPPTPVYHFAVMDVGVKNTIVTVKTVDSKIIDQFTLKNIAR